MGALDKDNPGVAAVTRVRDLLRQLLDEAPQTNAIEPALNQADFENLSGRVTVALSSDEPFQDEAEMRDAAKTHQFAVIETAARDLFDRLIASTSIDSPEFCKMWHLLDILSILSDNGQCDPALLFWLVEVLLDSQTIAGCRKIFDYLESRRERITAKHFKQKNLVILRSCNELLRRLSRAEDTAFCGRVFIFMFQSFPLGDRSSVNLRGEFHVENVTNYQESPSAGDESKMDLDKDSTDDKLGNKAATSASKKAQKPFDPDALYTQFWSLQDSFSQPLKLFEAPHFARFKSNLEATMKAFQAIQNAEGPQSFKSADGSKRDMRRRKEDEAEDDGPETFNPKYLTSKDLFELEIGDLSLRRHVLVQALIIIDFVLSLSPGMKEKLSGGNASNKAVLYSDQVDEENIKWANDMKTTISDYLKRGHDGPYFYRMVETVLARDKNWISWKMASCPPIQREPVSWHTFSDTKTSAQRLATTKRLRPIPLNAVNMDYLRDDHSSRDLSLRRDPSRYQLPDLDSFKQGIADDDFDLATAKDDEARINAASRKASKTWRALRLASRFKMAAFDKIDDDDDISPIFQPLLPSDDEASNRDEAFEAPDPR
ncbi:nuclear matrix protein [Ophiocordyceps camponoti-floridani]|uniref:Nuclear matrix protein n=1 Tax=Ophiocordyceps camponoti-floridani TaxID=2030778 RepID=A0A8H4Q9N2_9HYPO|nr:nuclear matrix protein [Ophiocordyceps camponoti-floridani]